MLCFAIHRKEVNVMKQNNRIRDSLNENLSGLTVTQTRRNRMLREITGGKKVRTKLTVSLVFAIVLVLIASIAVAAVLLSMREVVTEKAVPLANQTEGDRYTVEETNLLLSLAKENGIVLSDHAIESIDRDLEKENGYYKEELIMAMAKAEFGPMPAQWTLEEQNWFDDVCVAIGFIPQKNHFVPAQGEITEEEALKTALAHIAGLGETADLTDETQYDRYVQFMGEENDDSGEYRKIWDIEYEAKSLTGSSYYLVLSSAGEVESCYSPANAVQGGDANEWYQQLWDYEIKEKGDAAKWSPEQWVYFHEQVAKIPLDQKGLFRPLRAFARQVYAVPDDVALTKEEAVALAKQRAGEEGQPLQALNNTTCVYLMDGEKAIWKVTFIRDDGEFYVEMDAYTGETNETRYCAFSSSEHRWFARYVLFQISDTIFVEDLPSNNG